jgi:hypothetical protein
MIFTSRPDAACNGIQAILCRTFVPASAITTGGHSKEGEGVTFMQPHQLRIEEDAEGDAAPPPTPPTCGDNLLEPSPRALMQPAAPTSAPPQSSANAGRVMVFDTVISECGLSEEPALVQVRRGGEWRGRRRGGGG